MMLTVGLFLPLQKYFAQGIASGGIKDGGTDQTEGGSKDAY